MDKSAAEIMLDMIYDDVDQQLNPDHEECPTCGDDGYISDCFDGCCVDAEYGCDDCTRRCPECARYNARRQNAIKAEVIKLNRVDVAREWLKAVDRWHPDITDQQIQKELNDMRARAEGSAP